MDITCASSLQDALLAWPGGQELQASLLDSTYVTPPYVTPPCRSCITPPSCIMHASMVHLLHAHAPEVRHNLIPSSAALCSSPAKTAKRRCAIWLHARVELLPPRVHNLIALCMNSSMFARLGCSLSSQSGSIQDVRGSSTTGSTRATQFAAYA